MAAGRWITPNVIANRIQPLHTCVCLYKWFRLIKLLAMAAQVPAFLFSQLQKHFYLIYLMLSVLASVNWTFVTEKMCQ